MSIRAAAGASRSAALAGRLRRDASPGPERGFASLDVACCDTSGVPASRSSKPMVGRGPWLGRYPRQVIHMIRIESIRRLPTYSPSSPADAERSAGLSRLPRHGGGRRDLDPADVRVSDRLDVAVIGGGIVGLAAAHHLLRDRPGLRLAVIEKEPELARAPVGAQQRGTPRRPLLRPRLAEGGAVPGGQGRDRTLRRDPWDPVPPPRQARRRVDRGGAAEVRGAPGASRSQRRGGARGRRAPSGSASWNRRRPASAACGRRGPGSSTSGRWPWRSPRRSASRAASIYTGRAVTGLAERADGVVLSTTAGELRRPPRDRLRRPAGRPSRGDERRSRAGRATHRPVPRRLLPA